MSAAEEREDTLNAIRDGVRGVVQKFDDEYWLERDEDGKFPNEFHRAMADAGWLGITMPEEYGGSGLGVTEAAIMMHEVANNGGGMAACSARIPSSCSAITSRSRNGFRGSSPVRTRSPSG